MSADLLDEDAPDAEDFLACWIAPLMRCATERKTNDVLPFCVVARVAGGDDAQTGTDDAVIQLDVYARGALDASQAARDLHRRMSLLSRNCPDVTMSDGTKANADYCDCTLRFFRMPYDDDQIVRYTARYQLGLSYVAV